MTEPAQVADLEVSAKMKRQRRSAVEKLRILKAADACTVVGELGAMLRREAVYSSSLSSWRRARDLGALDALGPKKRGPKPVTPDARDRKIVELEKAVAKAELRAKRAERLVELQKKSVGVDGGRASAGRRAAMIDLVQTVGPALGIAAACAALGVSRATLPTGQTAARAQKHNARAMTCDEKVGHHDRRAWITS